MIPVILLKGVEPVAAGKSVASGRDYALHLLPQLDPGDILSARVEAKLPDGSYKVMVSGQPLRMALPSNIVPGDTLELAFVAREPRLTFALKDMPQAASTPTPAPVPAPAPAPALSAAGRADAAITPQAGEPALPSSLAPGDAPEPGLVARAPRPIFTPAGTPQAASAPAAAPIPAPAPVLSAAGRLVAATMLPPGELALPVTTSAAAPLLAAPPADGARLSGALAQTLAGSGLFYESHQAEWVGGKRELAQIRLEPQARLTRSAPPPEARAVAAAAVTIELPSSAPAQREQQTIDPRTAPLVQQQLAALDTAKVILQLEIWPRQWMQWEIEEHRPGAGREPDTPQSWNTQLRLKLPQLGELQAALTLVGDGMRIRLETASAASAALLRDHRASLQAALAAAGVPPAAIAIAQHEQA